MKAVDDKIAQLKGMGDDYSALDPFANSDINLDELTSVGLDPFPMEVTDGGTSGGI